MSKLNFKSDLFIESEELSRVVKFLKDEGYLRFLKLLVKNYGIFKDKDVPSETNFLIVPGVVEGTISLANKSYAFDSDGNVISCEAFSNLSVPLNTGNDCSYLKIAYQESVFEEGTLVVDSIGNVTGTGTKFLELLRGLPNFSSRILVVPESKSLAEGTSLEVVRVISDVSMIVQGEFSGLAVTCRYKILGTFTEDSIYLMNQSEQYLYVLDGCLLTVVHGVLGVSPALVSGKEFLIAIVQNASGIITVTDLRDNYALELNKINDDEFAAKLNRQNLFQKNNIDSFSVLTIDSDLFSDYLIVGYKDHVIISISSGTDNLLIKGIRPEVGVNFSNGTEITIEFNAINVSGVKLYNDPVGTTYFYDLPHFADQTGITVKTGDVLRVRLDTTYGINVWKIVDFYTKSALVDVANIFSKKQIFQSNVEINKLLSLGYKDETSLYSFNNTTGILTLTGESNHVFITNFNPGQFIVGVTNMKAGTVLVLRIVSVTAFPVFATTQSTPATKLLGIDKYNDFTKNDAFLPTDVPFEVVLLDTGANNEWIVLSFDDATLGRVKLLEDRLNQPTTNPVWIEATMSTNYVNNPLYPVKWRIDNSGILQIKGEFSAPTTSGLAFTIPVNSLGSGVVVNFNANNEIVTAIFSNIGQMTSTNWVSTGQYNRMNLSLVGYTKNT